MQFEIGQIIEHKLFGTGKIFDIILRETPFGTPDAPLIMVDFNGDFKKFADFSLSAFIV